MTTAIGGDVQAVAPVAAAMRTHGRRYLDRVFSAAEQRDLEGADAACLAARFAAKEAVSKLLGGADGVDVRWVEVLGRPGTRPRVRLRRAALDQHLRSGLGPIEVTLSHGGGMAFAVAVAVAAAPPADPKIADPTRIL